MKIIAHRSGPTVYPEQTVLSAQIAMKKGADLVEIDVRMTFDGEIVISHDENVLRVFGVDKAIGEMTRTEFLALRHKENRAFPSHLFEDYLFCDIKPLLIHIKEDEVIDSLLRYIDKYEYRDKAVLGVQSIDLAEKIKKHNPKIKVLAFVPELAAVTDFCKSDVDYIRLWESWLNEENAALVRAYNKELWVMTADGEVGVTTKENLKRIMDFNVDGILINDIELINI